MTREEINARFDGLKDSLDGLKSAIEGVRHIQNVTMVVIGLLVAVGIAISGYTITKVDAIPALLAEEFRAMRAEMASQTSAIANSITATKQQAPQVILVPPPQQ